jgi:hypothetical protein
VAAPPEATPFRDILEDDFHYGGDKLAMFYIPLFSVQPEQYKRIR